MLAPAIVLLCMLAPVVGLVLYATGKGSIRVLISALLLASLPMLGAVDGIFQRWVPVKNQWSDAKDQFNDPALAEMAKYIWREDTASMKSSN